MMSRLNNSSLRRGSTVQAIDKLTVIIAKLDIRYGVKIF